jgi:tetratricopeptide (TPR) repeat protein
MLTFPAIVSLNAQIPANAANFKWRELSDDQFKAKLVSPTVNENFLRVLRKAVYYDSLENNILALQYIDSCLLYQPDFGDLYLMKAQQYLDMNEGIAANFALEIADSLGCDKVIYILRPINQLFNIRDTTGVYKDLRQSANYYSDTPGFWMLVGLYEYLDEQPDYLNYFDKAESLSPVPDANLLYLRFVLMSGDYSELDSADVLVALAEKLKPMLLKDSYELLTVYKTEFAIYLDFWRILDAEKCLKEAIQLFPEDAELNLYMAQMYFQDSIERDRYLFTAEKNAMDNPNVWYQLALLKMNVDDTIYAVRCFEKVLQYKDDPYSLLQLAEIKRAQRKVRTSEGYMKKAVRIIITNNYYLGLVDQIDRDYAVFVYDSIIGIGNPTEDVYISRAYFNIHTRNYTKAIDDFTKAIALNPANADAWHGRGNARYLSGDKKGGCADLRKAVSLGDSSAVNIVNESCVDY